MSPLIKNINKNKIHYKSHFFLQKFDNFNFTQKHKKKSTGNVNFFAKLEKAVFYGIGLVSKLSFIISISISISILTFFWFQNDICYSPGWLPISQKNWYYTFLLLILVQVLILFWIQKIKEKIKTSFIRNQKQKRNGILALDGITLLASVISIPFIRIFYAYVWSYQRSYEIIFNHPFLGIFRRTLTTNERIKLYEEFKQEFLENRLLIKEIKDQLQDFDSANLQSFIQKCNHGSEVAKKYFYEQLEDIINLLQLQIQLESLDNKITEEFTQKKITVGIYDQIINSLNTPTGKFIGVVVVLVVIFILFRQFHGNVSSDDVSIDTRMDSVVNNLEVMNGHIVAMQNKITTMNVQQSEINTVIGSKVETVYIRTTNFYSEARSNITSIQHTLHGLREKMKSLQSEQTLMNTKLDLINTKLDSIKTKLDSMNTSISEINIG